jgi:ATP-dependent Clp protease ATP-binding subunit ClpA
VEKNQEKNKPVISKEDVAYVVSKMTGIPFKLEEEESQKLLHMEEGLHKGLSDRMKQSPLLPSDQDRKPV